MVTAHLQAHRAHLRWMVAASGPRPKDPVHQEDQTRDNFSKEECSNEEEIPYPLEEQVTKQLPPLTVSLSTGVTTSASNVSVKCLPPRALTQSHDPQVHRLHQEGGANG